MGDTLNQLLSDMRSQVVWTDKATMPIPLYERMKAAIIAAMGDASIRKDEEPKGVSLDSVETSPASSSGYSVMGAASSEGLARGDGGPKPHPAPASSEYSKDWPSADIDFNLSKNGKDCNLLTIRYPTEKHWSRVALHLCLRDSEFLALATSVIAGIQHQADFGDDAARLLLQRVHKTLKEQSKIDASYGNNIKHQAQPDPVSSNDWRPMTERPPEMEPVIAKTKHGMVGIAYVYKLESEAPQWNFMAMGQNAMGLWDEDAVWMPLPK